MKARLLEYWGSKDEDLEKNSSICLEPDFVHRISSIKDIFAVHQCTGESVRDYAERYQTAIVLLASETDPFDGLLNAHRKQWTQGLHAEM